MFELRIISNLESTQNDELIFHVIKFHDLEKRFQTVSSTEVVICVNFHLNSVTVCVIVNFQSISFISVLSNKSLL